MAPDEDPDSKHAASKAQTSTPEDKANEDPSTSKLVATPPSPGPTTQAMDPDDVAAIEELEEQELMATPPHSKEFLARRDAAEKRREQREAKKLARKRELNAAANRKLRARKKAAEHDAPAPSLPTLGAKWATRRLHALIKATSDYKADKRLVKLRTREEEIVRFVQLRRLLGESATRAEIAKLMGDDKSPESVKNLTELVRKLEQPGGPWHDME